MTEFTQIHSNLLLFEPWRVKPVSDIAYLFKFHASDLGCCFLITDTKHVWAEALENRHISRRYRRGLRSAGDEIHHEDEAWQRTKELVALHSPQRLDSLEFSVMPLTKEADLEVCLKLGSYEWKWEAMSVGRMGADILSRHLIIPMITLNECALKSPQRPNTMDDSTWTKHLDIVAKTSRVTNPVHVLLRKPRVSTSLCRISQIQARAQNPCAVQSAFSDNEILFPPNMTGVSLPPREDELADFPKIPSPSPESTLLFLFHDDHTERSPMISGLNPRDDQAHASPDISSGKSVSIPATSSASPSTSKLKHPSKITVTRSPSPQAANRSTAADKDVTGNESETDDAPVRLGQNKGKGRALQPSQVKNDSTVTNVLNVKHEPRVNDANLKSPLDVDGDATEEEESQPALRSGSRSGILSRLPVLPSKRKSDGSDGDDDSSDAVPQKSAAYTAGEGRGQWKGPRRAVTKKRRF
ncbi:hypothetical protein BS47DRAFT_1399316 [Hydnum rufescens UP504]|uniref:XLF-like N-terminal domain-containing protein n=1 Tax=Hydnum rufescens UP504 TaxID=1448309 RepID=A0A9P6AJ34_9AGAM|nr:hypothetical protein BS47DRAFT_1399316 [Hydnum rufescens UP504]